MGILSSIVASLILFYFRYNLGFIINFIFFKVYPNVSGEYTIYQYNFDSNKSGDKKSVEKSDGKNGVKLRQHATNQELLAFLKGKERKVYHVMKLRQFAYKISGEILLIKGGKVEIIEELTGRVTASRVIILSSENKSKDHHDFGTYLINLTPDKKIIKGTRSSLCISCGNATSIYQIMEKNS